MAKKQRGRKKTSLGNLNSSSKKPRLGVMSNVTYLKVFGFLVVLTGVIVGSLAAAGVFKKGKSSAKTTIKSTTASAPKKDFKNIIFTNETLREAVNEYLSNKQAAIKKYGEINSWNVSKVTDMSELFKKSDFNDDISAWDTSSVNDMNFMFFKSKFNNQNSINTKKVTVNGKTYTAWDVSNVTDMSGLFFASDFNGDISAWDTSSVNDMTFMFSNSKFNNQNSINTKKVTVNGKTYTAWDVSKVIKMSFMFPDSKFNGDISAWDTSSVKSMNSTFRNAKFNNKNSINTKIVTINGKTYTAWDVSNVNDMIQMFYCSDFIGDISDWTINCNCLVAEMYDCFPRKIIPEEHEAKKKNC